DAGSTSMEVGVRVEAENLATRRSVHTSSADLVVLAADAGGKTRGGPPGRAAEGRRTPAPGRSEAPAGEPPGPGGRHPGREGSGGRAGQHQGRPQAGLKRRAPAGGPPRSPHPT